MGGDPRANWATPAKASAFWGTQVHAFEREGGEHNSKLVPPERFSSMVAEARSTLGWGGVKVDLYCLDHSVREVDRTFTQLGWHFHENRPDSGAGDEEPTVAVVYRAMKVLEQYFSRYTPNELPKGTSLLEPVDEDTKKVEAGPVEVTQLTELEMPFSVKGTKRGTMPVMEEKHKHNYVTMVKNVDGDRKALLLELRNFIGAGGHLVEGGVEIQGRHLEKVEEYLVMRGCLVGVSAAGAAAAAERVGDQTLDKYSDKKMMEGMQRGKDKKAKRERKQRKARGESVPTAAAAEEDAAPADGDEAADADAGAAGGKDKGVEHKEKDVDYVGKMKRRIDEKGVEKAGSWWRKTLTKTTLDYKAALDVAFKACFSTEIQEEAERYGSIFLPLVQTPKAELHMITLIAGSAAHHQQDDDSSDHAKLSKLFSVFYKHEYFEEMALRYWFEKVAQDEERQAAGSFMEWLELAPEA